MRPGAKVVVTASVLAARTSKVRESQAPRGYVNSRTQYVFLVNQRGAFVRAPGDCKGRGLIGLAARMGRLGWGADMDKNQEKQKTQEKRRRKKTEKEAGYLGAAKRHSWRKLSMWRAEDPKVGLGLIEAAYGAFPIGQAIAVLARGAWTGSRSNAERSPSAALPCESAERAAEVSDYAGAFELTEGRFSVRHGELVAGVLDKHAILLGDGRGKAEASVDVRGVARDGRVEPADRERNLLPVVGKTGCAWRSVAHC